MGELLNVVDFMNPESNKHSNYKKKYIKSIIQQLFAEKCCSNEVEFYLDIVETECTNPECRRKEPHTFVYVNWSTGGSGSFVIPLPLSKIDKYSCGNFLPSREVINLWYQGIKSQWPPTPSLRFSIGTVVQCNLAAGWVYGKIVNTYYTEDDWSPIYSAPYQIMLSNGSCVYAPIDNDEFVRLVKLRFKVGDRVNCRINTRSFKGWNYGTVIKLFYFEPGWPVDRVAPYQVKLHTDDLIFVPYDDESIIVGRPEPPLDAPSSPYVNYDDLNADTF
jgi:hypothetical protein